MKYQTRGILSLISGCLIHTAFGGVYTLGAITPYIASYLKYSGNPDIKVVDISINYPLLMITWSIGIILSMLKLQNYFSLKQLVFIGMIGYCSSVLIASFMDNQWTFSLFYGFFFGFLIGIAYMAPFKNTYSYFPDRKGLCSGVCTIGYGIGAFVYNQLFLLLINPENKPANEDHFFPKDVAMNFPFALRIMAGIYAIVGLTGCFLFFENKEGITKQETLLEQQNQEYQIQKQRSELQSTITFFKQNPQRSKFGLIIETDFYQIFAITFLSSVYGLFMAYNYKQYGEIITQNDRLITLLGSLGAIANSLGRLFWNFLFDYFSFRRILTILNVSLLIQCLLCIFFSNEILYFMIVLGTYFSHGAYYGLIPAQTFRIFGQKIGGIVYPFVFIGFTCASLTQFIFHEIVIRKWGNDGFTAAFIGFGVFQLIGLICVNTFIFEHTGKQQQQHDISQDRQSSEQTIN